VMTPAGQTTVAGRSASRYKLSLGKGVPTAHTGRRAWRARLKAMRIEGEAQLDTASGAVLALKVTYAVSAPKAGRTVTITGDFDGAVVEAGKPQVIKPPADFAVARARPREARELRMLGSQRLNPGWFRGGGPHAARRGGATKGMKPAPSMEHRPRRPMQPSRPRARTPMQAPRPRARTPMVQPPSNHRPRPMDKPSDKP